MTAAEKNLSTSLPRRLSAMLYDALLAAGGLLRAVVQAQQAELLAAWSAPLQSEQAA